MLLTTYYCVGLAANLQQELHETFEVGYPKGTKGPDGRTALELTQPNSYVDVLLFSGFCVNVMSSFTFDLSTGAQDFPRIAYEMKWGTKTLRWDVSNPFPLGPYSRTITPVTNCRKGLRSRLGREQVDFVPAGCWREWLRRYVPSPSILTTIPLFNHLPLLPRLQEPSLPTAVPPASPTLTQPITIESGLHHSRWLTSSGRPSRRRDTTSGGLAASATALTSSLETTRKLLQFGCCRFSEADQTSPRMRFAALNPLGDPAKADHWDVYEAAAFTVVSSPHWE